MDRKNKRVAYAWTQGTEQWPAAIPAKGSFPKKAARACSIATGPVFIRKFACRPKANRSAAIKSPHLHDGSIQAQFGPNKLSRESPLLLPLRLGERAGARCPDLLAFI